MVGGLGKQTQKYNVHNVDSGLRPDEPKLSHNAVYNLVQNGGGEIMEIREQVSPKQSVTETRYKTGTSPK